MNMIAGIQPDKFGTIGGLLNLAEPKQRECPHPVRPEHHRIERAETSRDISRAYRASGIARLARHKCKGVVGERVVGTKTKGLIEAPDGAIGGVTDPLASTAAAMCRRG